MTRCLTFYPCDERLHTQTVSQPAGRHGPRPPAVAVTTVSKGLVFTRGDSHARAPHGGALRLHVPRLAPQLRKSTRPKNGSCSAKIRDKASLAPQGLQIGTWR
jgi:hypothetical protein